MEDGTFKQAMSRFPAGVTIVTTIAEDGSSWGFTASSFASVSLDPPLVLVCLACDAHCASAFGACSTFAVNVLAPEHAGIAMTFASKGLEKFSQAQFEAGRFGNPLLPSAIASVECEVEERFAGGDHIILLGRVIDARATSEEPVVYFDRSFHRLGETVSI